MRGTSVTVYYQIDTGTVDEFNTPIMSERSEQVYDVLIAPGARTDVTGSIRPDGVKVAYSLHFPKTYMGRLRGAEIEIDGKRYKVIGDPMPYMSVNCPTRWNRPVEVEVIDG